MVRILSLAVASLLILAGPVAIAGVDEVAAAGLSATLPVHTIGEKCDARFQSGLIARTHEGALIACRAGEFNAVGDDDACGVNAGALFPAGTRSDQAPRVVVVSKSLCVETSRFPNFAIGDSEAWKFVVIARDANKQALAYKIIAPAKKSRTNVILHEKNGQSHFLIIDSGQ